MRVKPEPFFVILRIGSDGQPFAESQCFETEKYADLRVDHLAKLDGIRAVRQLITPPYTWLPVDREGDTYEPYKFGLPRGAAMTVGRGQELLDYSQDYRPLSLGQQIELSWNAWREGQAAKGNFEEAAKGPEIPDGLFEPPGQLRLFPRELP
jgi:hypothetical protein